MERVLTALLRKSISIRDTYARKDLRENFYHGFMLGLLQSHGWDIASNRESGNGYSDIEVRDYNTGIGAVLELKYSEDASKNAMEAACKKGIDQINEKDYASSLFDDGMTEVIKYGISFNKKRACVRM